jgi:hypothetical protein
LLVWVLAAHLGLAAGSETLQEFRTPSGLRVFLDERHERPLVRLELRLAWDDRALPSGSECAGELMCAVLGRCGAGGFSRMALERTLADRGLKLGLEGGRHSLAWSMLADSQDQEDAFAFLAHAVFRPILAEGVSSVQQDSKRAVTSEDAFKAGLNFLTEGVTTCDLDLPGFLALHRRLVRPKHAVLVIQGDLSLVQARQLVLLHLGTWGPASEAPTEGEKAPLRLASRQTIPGGERAAWAGSLAPEGKASARAAHVLLAFLLERVLRLTPGETIAVEAPRPEGDVGPILFRTLVSVSSDPERLLRDRLDRLAASGFSAADLEGAKRQWRAERLALALHPEEQLSAWAHRFLRGDPGAFLEEIQLEGVNAALRSRISPQALHWLVKGN